MSVVAVRPPFNRAAKPVASFLLANGKIARSGGGVKREGETVLILLAASMPISTVA
ncbi:hypothetical protein FACS189475_02190 [Betaproteobacteria bacterium]|nr:hypothetical protein FACS189475_02190 [Betaproteobacteria bacterium]